MAIDTIRVRTEPSAGSSPAESPPSPGVVEVSELPTARIRALAGESAAGEVYFERRGGRTYLVAGR